MERTKVYDIIDGEREYQDLMTRNSDRPDMIEDFHLGDALSAIQFNLDVARKEWYTGAVPHQDAMAYIRKIAAISVKMMEVHGAPERYIPVQDNG